jgi:hypothetical protein
MSPRERRQLRGEFLIVLLLLGDLADHGLLCRLSGFQFRLGFPRQTLSLRLGCLFLVSQGLRCALGRGGLIKQRRRPVHHYPHDIQALETVLGRHRIQGNIEARIGAARFVGLGRQRTDFLLVPGNLGIRPC